MDSALLKIAQQLVASGKGVLAADESSGTIKKRFEALGIEDSVENHRKYRELLFTTPNIEEYISGVIMFEETLRQKTADNVSFPDYLGVRGVLPGIKIDQGLEPFKDSEIEKTTKGLEDLGERLGEYRGAKFTKFRSIFTISENTPTPENIAANAEIQAQLAKGSQEKGLLPICEPEVLMDGNHSLAKCQEVTTQVLKELFVSLKKYEVDIGELFVKTNMILPGKEAVKAEPKEVARATIEALRNSVPAEVPAIVFLSGGQSPDEACANLNAIVKTGEKTWALSFSFARALQSEAIEAWRGKDENVTMAQEAFLKRARLVSLARQGKL